MKTPCYSAFDLVWRMRDNQHLKMIAYAENYVMVRSRGAMPFVMSLKEWMALPPCGAPRPDRSPDRTTYGGHGI